MVGGEEEWEAGTVSVLSETTLAKYGHREKASGGRDGNFTDCRCIKGFAAASCLGSEIAIQVLLEVVIMANDNRASRWIAIASTTVIGKSTGTLITVLWL